MALFKEALELVLEADTAHGDALGTPSVAIGSGKDLGGSQHVVEVVHRLALTHKHDVGKLVTLGQTVDLIEDVSGCEIALKALLTRLAEETVHLAAYLTRNAECGTIILGDVYRLDKLGACRCRVSTGGSHDGEEIFDGSVLGVLGINRLGATNLIVLVELLAVDLGDVCHLVDGTHMLGVDPFCHLSSGEGRHAERHGHLLELGQCHAKEIFLIHGTIHSAKIQTF